MEKMKKNRAIFHNLNNINISNSNSNLNESQNKLDKLLFNDDILSYSEDKSQSLTNINNQNQNNLTNKKVQSLKNRNIKQEDRQSSINKEKNSINNDTNNELSALQISLSNLLSDIESIDFLMNDKKNLIDISKEASNDNENNNNIKIKKNQNEDMSSMCNYSKSLYNGNDNTNNSNLNNFQKIIKSNKKKYQIEKGENININLTAINNNNADDNNYFNTINNNLSINKTQNFTIINNNTIEANNNYLSERKNYNEEAMKNKLKLINKKNINIIKEDSNNFFYNPKQTKIYHYQTEVKINNNNKDIKTKSDNKKNILYKKLNINSVHKKNNLSYHKNNKNNNKNKIYSHQKLNSIQPLKKLHYLHKIKIKDNTFQIKTSPNKNITLNNKVNKILKSKKSENNCITEPTKYKNSNTKNKYFYDSSKKKESRISKDLMAKLKSEQKMIKNNLIHKLNSINKNNTYKINANTNIINFFPIFTQFFEKKIVKKKEKNNMNKKKENFNNKNKNQQINLISLLNNFNEHKNKKNNKSLYNFGNIYFINQAENRNQIHKKSETEVNIKNNNIAFNNVFNNLKQKPQIIDNFSNYKKKSQINCKININK